MQGQNRAWDEGNPRNLHGQDSEPATMAFIYSAIIQFVFSREEPRETRPLRSQDLSILASSDIHGQGHSAFIIQHHSFYSSAEKNAEKRVCYAAKCSQYPSILAFSAYIHGQGHSTFIIQHYSILQEKHLEIRIQK